MRVGINPHQMLVLKSNFMGRFSETHKNYVTNGDIILANYIHLMGTLKNSIQRIFSM